MGRLFDALRHLVARPSGGELISAPTRRGLDRIQIAEALAAQIHTALGRLPAPTLERLVHIQRIVLSEILPTASDAPIGSEELFVVERTATSYLPEALGSYLRLPPDYAARPLEGGLTPLEMLDEQLALLETKLTEVAEAMHRQDSETLLIHGRFLEERFGPGELRPG